MGRLERDLKKKVKNTKKDYSEWYSEHEQQILQRVDENNSEVDLGSVKVKRRVPVKVWILGGVIIVLAAIIAMSVLLSKTDSEVPEIPDFTFSEEEITEFEMSEAELNEVVEKYTQLSNFEALDGMKILYGKDSSLVMNIVDGELETADDFYFINVTEIEYEAKVTDDYGMYLYYAVTKTEGATMYWKVSCIEGLFNEWLQVMFA